MPYMKNADLACRGRFLLNRIVHSVSPVPFSVMQNMYFLLEILGLIRYGAAVRQVFQRSNSRNDAIEPFFGPIEAPLLLDVCGDFVQVGKSPWCNLNAKSHAFYEASAPPLGGKFLRRALIRPCLDVLRPRSQHAPTG